MYASNRLYNGECSSLNEALQLVVDELEAEIMYMQRHPDPLDADTIADFQSDMKQVSALKDEYEKAIQEVTEKLMAKWKEEKGWASMLADAYWTADYSRLAI